MSSPPWFYCAFDKIGAQTLEVSGAEANHIIGARRLHINDALVVMNGRGKLAHCVIAKVNKKARVIKLNISRLQKTAPPEYQLVLATALPKGGRLATMLDMACQLGMTHFQPLTFSHSASKWSDKLITRCDRIVVEAAKQSQRAWLPHILKEKTFETMLQFKPNDHNLYFLADQNGQALQYYQSAIKSASRFTLLVGPEAGLSVLEKKVSQAAGILPLSLAVPKLRIETAAVSALAAFNQIT